MIKFKIPSKDRLYVTYKCERCGEVTEYTIELPPHLRIHLQKKNTRYCGGKQVEISRRTENATKEN